MLDQSAIEAGQACISGTPLAAAAAAAAAASKCLEATRRDS